jgi:deoxyribodipyrimidine photo-lyase
LRANLAALGYRLIVRSGPSEIELPRLAREAGAEAVFCNRRYEPYARARDQRVALALDAAGVRFHCRKDAVIWEEREILTGAGEPYTVFTPYSKAWKTRPAPPPWPKLARASRVSPAYPSEEVPLDPAVFGFPLKQSLPAPGERAGSDALKRFIAESAARYGDRRDFPALAGTSQLSAHFRAGTIGIRSVLSRLAEAETTAAPSEKRSFEVFRNELIWREFYIQVLANFPAVSHKCFRSRYDRLAWSGTDEQFEAWCRGLTGYPVVDAAMRCLNATGWMHNRLRMIVAMFLTKDLMVDWRRGERYFMQQLVDGDMAANNGGWQWSAGTGTDAAPYFRVFNPTAQATKFDPQGDFTRQWLPELADFSEGSIHEPWERPLVARAAGYPDRVVRHDEQRVKCLAMFERLK